MRRLSPRLRFLALAWATLQLVSPGLSAVGHGLATRENAGEPVSHVEATSTSACPAAHAPECGVCRYLSGVSAPPQDGAPLELCDGDHGTPGASLWAPDSRALALPRGRAPPVL